MSKSFQEVVSDGTLRNIVLSLDYLAESDIYLRIAGEDIPKTGHETYSWVFSNNIITITPAVTAGYKVVVYRRTATTEMLNIYGQNAQFSESSMDENFTQLLYLSQEYMEQGSGTEVISECEFIRSDTYNNYYRLVLNDGSTTPEFAIPKAIAEGATVGTFAAGCTLSNVGDTALHSDGHIYGWTGAFPHTIAPGSSPTPLGAGYYVDRSDSTLRTQLSRVMQALSPDGYFGMVNLPNIKDWGAVGDGVYHPLQEWVDSGKFSSLLAIQMVYPRAESLSQSIDQLATQSCLDANRGRNVQASKGRYIMTHTTISPKGTSLYGEGKYDPWESDKTVGVIFETYGNGNPKRYTDIDGNDAADDTPLFVAGGPGVYFHNMALVSPDWSIGIHYPSVRQCGFSQLIAYGFTDACVYLDMTWSPRNTVMTALHPDIETDGGMNEFSGFDFYLRTDAPGSFALKVQGTTRPGNAVATADEWQWGYGGASDARLMHGRLNGGGVGGGCFKHDAQLFGTNSFAQGFTLRDVALRLHGAGRYMASLDRSNRIIFDGCYGEHATSGAVPYFAVTSRTQQSNDGIIRVNDRLSGAGVLLDEVVVGSNSSPKWSDTRCITVYKADGIIATPNITAYNRDAPVLITSFQSDGNVLLGKDDGSTQTFYHLFSPTLHRPLVTGMTLGSTSSKWANTHTEKVTATTTLTLDCADINGFAVIGNSVNPVIRPVTDGGGSLGTVSYPWLNVRAHNLYSDSGAVQVSDINYKTDIASLSDEVLDAWADVNYCQFRMLNGSRLHAGTVVQWILQAFETRGLDATAYGVVCHETWPAKPAVGAVYAEDGSVLTPAIPAQAAGEQWTLRWNECAAFEAALQRRTNTRLQAKVSDLEARLLALEAKIGS